MATVTLPVAAVFPDGGEVSAYAASGIPVGHSGPPPSAALSTATVAAGQVTFTGLVASGSYKAAGEVDGRWRYLDFIMDDASAPIPVYADVDANITGEWHFDTPPTGIEAPVPLVFPLDPIGQFVSPQAHVIQREEYLPTQGTLPQRFEMHGSYRGIAGLSMQAITGPASAGDLTATYQGQALPAGATAHALGMHHPGIAWGQLMGGSFTAECEVGTPWATEIAVAVTGVQQGIATGDKPVWVDVSKIVDRRGNVYAAIHNGDADSLTVARIGHSAPHYWDDVLETIALPDAAGKGDVAVDLNATHAVVANFGDDSISVITMPGATGDVTPVLDTTYALPGGHTGPVGVEISNDGSVCWVTCETSETVCRFSMTARTFASSIALTAGAAPTRGKFVGTKFLVCLPGRDRIAKIDTGTLAVTESAVIASGADPVALAKTPDLLSVWVACHGTNVISRHLVSDLSLPEYVSCSGHAPASVAITPDGLALIAAMDTADIYNYVQHYNLEATPPVRYVSWTLTSRPSCVALTEYADILFTCPASDIVHDFGGGNLVVGNDAFSNTHGKLLVYGAEEA